MDHTYLRYECADSFGLLTTSSSSKVPHSNSNLCLIKHQDVGSSVHSNLLFTTAGSQAVAINLKTGLPTLKLGHSEKLSGGAGSGKALNSDQIVCLDISTESPSNGPIQVATGWVDGAVRVFDVESKRLSIHYDKDLTRSLLEEHDDSAENGDEPLLLSGHQTPVRSLAFDERTASRLASGGSDGTVILWDIGSETGLFRLIGHKGGITDIIYLRFEVFDGLITSSLDGLVKIWDLGNQYCQQTIANHHGEVLSAVCIDAASQSDGEQGRWRLITGAADGRVRVWSPKRLGSNTTMNDDDETLKEALPLRGTRDEVCSFMGHLIPPPNVATSAEKVLSVRSHSSGRYIGVLHANSKNVDVYVVRSEKASLKRRLRRLKRRQEKHKKKESQKSVTSEKPLFDEPDSQGLDDDKGLSGDDAFDPEMLRASDEFDFLTTVRASNKVNGFSFCEGQSRSEITRLVCALSTNALETHVVSRVPSEV